MPGIQMSLGCGEGAGVTRHREHLPHQSRMRPPLLGNAGSFLVSLPIQTYEIPTSEILRENINMRRNPPPSSGSHAGTQYDRENI